MHQRNDETSMSPQDPSQPENPEAGPLATPVNRRGFIQQAAAISSAVGLSGAWAAPTAAAEPERLQPIGEAKGLHPGRVVWVHDPRVTNWKGPGDGRWYQPNHTSQERVDAMMLRALRDLTGESTASTAWDQLFRHFNRQRSKSTKGYRPGEKILIKPNWVGMIYTEGVVNPDTYTLLAKRQDYMNTGPQMIIALIRQLVGVAGVKETDITVCDTLAYLVHEYYDILHAEFPKVQYVDHAGKFGRQQVKASTVPLYWSCRPQGKPDFLPTCFTEAEYLINFATLKAHTATGVTLCGKNNFGSLIRWPVEQGYYNIHNHSFLQQKTKIYREQVDLLGHAHLGGKTVLYLIDGLFAGIHPIDQAPCRWSSAPFNGQWTCSLLASQDPVAIDSVGFDFLWAEYADHPRQPGADDFLHEAALAGNPPSGTFYDPNNPKEVKRLASLGVHEHWNNPQQKQYTRNLGTGKGIELVAARI